MLQGRLTVGQLVAVLGLVALTAVPALGLAGLWPEVLRFPRRLRELAESRALPPRPGFGSALPRLRGFVRIENVSYRHRPEGRDVLAHVSLELRPGQVVWVVGRTGAGKTALAMLLQGLLLPTEGRSTMDGFDLAAVDPRSLRAQVSVVAEEPALLHGTIRENIALADPAAPPARVAEAARFAAAHDFITRLPLGYATPLGPRGVELSRGQRQSLCIARALLKEPRLLVLDEATSALDAETEGAVLKHLRWLGRDRAVMILTRRPAAVRPGDLVVVLEGGQVAERGDPGELLKRGGCTPTSPVNRWACEAFRRNHSKEDLYDEETFRPRASVRVTSMVAVSASATPRGRRFFTRFPSAVLSAKS